LDSKKSIKSGKFGKPKLPYRPSSGSYGSYNYGNRGPSTGHIHDFTPVRGGGRGSSGSSGSTGYSYGTGTPNKYFDDYQDGPSYHSSSNGPKSFVSMSSHVDNDEPDDVINIDHGYDPSAHHPSSSTKVSPSYRGRTSSSHYESDPLHPLRDYHSTGHDDEGMYTRLRQEYQSKGRAKSQPSSPYYHSLGDYNEPDSTSVHMTRHRDNDQPDGKLHKKKTYWMSYTQNP